MNELWGLKTKVLWDFIREINGDKELPKEWSERQEES